MKFGLKLIALLSIGEVRAYSPVGGQGSLYGGQPGYGQGEGYGQAAGSGPQPDTQKNRAGSIYHVKIPNAMGVNPYGMSGMAANNPFMTPLPANQLYTDDSENGYRIRKVFFPTLSCVSQTVLVCVSPSVSPCVSVCVSPGMSLCVSLSVSVCASPGCVCLRHAMALVLLLQGLLDMHNYVRKLEAPAATFMTKLVWDYHLEAYSQQWAQYLCVNPSSRMFDHSPDNTNGLPAWPWRITTGENLYTSSAVRQPSEDFSNLSRLHTHHSEQPTRSITHTRVYTHTQTYIHTHTCSRLVTAGDVVSKWYAEREFYDWNTGNAKPGATQPVGHWKQLVRPQATAVGCSVVSGCRGEGDWRTFVACHYDYGNVGKDPYTPNYGGSARKELHV